MTLESELPDEIKDPEKFVASMSTNPFGIKEVVKVLIQRLKKDGWSNHDDRPATPKRFGHEREY